VKRARLLGVVVLLAPTAGCAGFPFNSSAATPPPAATVQAQGPNSGAQNRTADIEAAIRNGQVQRKAGDLAGAARTFSQLVLIAPDNAQVLGEYGKTLVGMGRSDDALAFLDRATQLDPADWTLYSAQGMAHDQQGNYKAAQVSYAHALMLKPGEPTVLNNDALSHIQAGDLDGAEKLLREAAPFTADYPRIAQNLTLIQNLRASQPKAMAVAPQPASPPQAVAAEQPPAVAVAQPNPPVSRPPAPLIVAPLPPAEPSVPAAVAEATETPVPPPAPVAENSPVEHPLSKLESLRADPRVVMAPIPMDDHQVAVVHAPAPMPAAVTITKPVPKPVETADAPVVTAAPARPSGAPRAYFVQAGAFFKPEPASLSASTLDKLGARVMPGENNGRAVFRVRIGPFLTIQQAKTAAAQAQAMGHADLIIVPEQ
jgi:Flp pilus assembly protein TadD